MRPIKGIVETDAKKWDLQIVNGAQRNIQKKAKWLGTIKKILLLTTGARQQFFAKFNQRQLDAYLKRLKSVKGKGR